MRNEDYGRIARILADGTPVELEIAIVNKVYPEGRTSTMTMPRPTSFRLVLSVPEVMNRATIERGDRDRPRARGRAGHVPRARGAEGRGTAHLRCRAICLSQTVTPRGRRAGSTCRRRMSRARSASTASCSAGRPRTRAIRRRPAATPCSTRRAPRRRPRADHGRGPPTYWSTYFATDDVDALTARVEGRGRQRPGRADGRHGRRPDGGLRRTRRAGCSARGRPAASPARELVNKPVSLAWNSLMTRDVGRRGAFLEAVFGGMRAETQNFGGAPYTILMLGDQRRRRRHADAARRARRGARLLERVASPWPTPTHRRPRDRARRQRDHGADGHGGRRPDRRRGRPVRRRIQHRGSWVNGQGAPCSGAPCRHSAPPRSRRPHPASRCRTRRRRASPRRRGRRS